MRINVYAEELTSQAEIVIKSVEGQMFYGIRLFLKSAKELHYTEGDDDRSAITMWVPWSKKKGFQPQVVIDALREMLQLLVKRAQFRGEYFQFSETELFKGIYGTIGIDKTE